MKSASRRSPDRYAAGPLIAVLGYVACLIVVPLGALGFVVATHLSEVVTSLRSGPALHAMGLTLAVAALCVVCNGVFGVAGALVLVRQRFLLRGLVDALVELPLALSPVMTGLGFLLLFGRTGPLGPLLDALGLRVAFAVPGVAVATLFVTLPFTLREVALVLEEIGDSEEQAAATLGASPWQAFWRVTLPNIQNGLVAGTVLTLARALGEFGAVLVVGGAIGNRTETATTFVHAAVESRAEPAAYGMALLLGAAAIAALGALQWTGKNR